MKVIVNEKNNSLTIKAKKTSLGIILRFVGLLSICIFLTLLNKNFLTINNLVNVLRQSTILIVVGLGLTCVLITAGIDLSVGGTMALVGCLVAQLLRQGIPIPLAILIGVGVGGLIGIINGTLVGIIGLPAFIATYGVMWITEGIAHILMQGKIIFGLPRKFLLLGQGYFFSIPIPIIIVGILSIIFYMLLKNTRLGRNFYALGANRDVSFYSGIRTNSTTIWVYSLSGITAAIAGILMTSRLDAAQAGMGEPFLLQGIAIVVMGGTSLLGGEGGIPGTIIGGLILTLMINGLNLMGVTSLVHSMVTGIVIIGAVMLDVNLRKWNK